MLSTRLRVATRLQVASLEGKIRYLAPMLKGKTRDPEAFIKSLLPLDPTGLKGDYLPVLATFVLQYGQQALPKGITEALAWHARYKKYLPAQYRDVNKLDLASLPEQVQTWSREHKTPDYVPSGAKTIYQEGPYRVVAVSDYSAMCHYSEGLGWCVKEKPFFEQYTKYQTPLHVILKDDKPYALVSLSSEEIKDIHNLKFDTRHEIEIWKFLQKVFPHASGIETNVAHLERVLETFQNPKNQRWIRDVPSLAFEYSVNYLGRKRFPEGESAIASDSSIALMYARDVLKDPDPSTWRDRYWAAQKNQT